MSMFIRQMSDEQLIIAAVSAIKCGAKQTARAIAREQRRRLINELQPRCTCGHKGTFASGEHGPSCNLTR